MLSSSHRTALSRQCNLLLLLLGLWISNTIIGCWALPRPQPQNYDEQFAVALGAPLITPLVPELLLEPDSNYVLNCEANEPILWKFPLDNDNMVLKRFNTTDPERPYGLELHINSVSYRDVGSYYCLKESALTKDMMAMDDDDFNELVNNNLATTIYVFVNDSEHLLAEVLTPFFNVHQYSDVTIPCKPTMPNTVVLLTGPDAETHSSENTGRYDPQRGFVINIRAVTESGTYTCLPAKPSPDNEEEQNFFSINFIGNDYIDISKTSTTTRTPLAPMAITPETVLESPTKMSNASAPTTATPSNIQSTVTNKTLNVTNRIIRIGDGDSLDVVQSNLKSISQHQQHDDDDDDENVAGDGLSASAANTQPDAFDNKYKNKKNNNNDINTNHNNDTDSSASIDNDIDIYNNDDDDDVSTLASNFVIVNKRRHKRRSLETTTQTARRVIYNHDQSTPRSKTDYINKPIIKSESRGHVYEGETFQLNCTLQSAHGVTYDMTWSYPKTLDVSRAESTRPFIVNQQFSERQQLGATILTVRNAKKSDSGVYTCKVQDHSQKRSHNTYTMTVLNRNESYLNISEPAGNYNIRQSANRTVKITVRYRGFPWPTLSWIKPDGTEVPNNHRYHIETTDAASTLEIKNVNVLDSGIYIMRASNEIEIKELKFTVAIDDVPVVSVDDIYVQENQEAHLVCSVTAHPQAVVTWTFTECYLTPRWPTCNKTIEQGFNSTTQARAGSTIYETIHELYFTPKTPGIMSCWAQNKIGRARAKAHVLIGDIAGNMTITGVTERQKVARGDRIELTCAALAYHYANDLYWYKGGELVKESNAIEITSNVSQYSYKKTLIFKSIQDDDRGSYECRTSSATINDEYESQFVNIFVHEPAAPKMLHTNLDANTKIKRKLGDPLELECRAEAIPHANVEWLKDDVKVESSKKAYLNEDGSKLIIPHLYPEDDGTYRCIVANRLGQIESSVTVKITNLPGLSLVWILLIVFIFAVLIALVFYLCIRVNRERKLLRELKAAGLANFEEGAVEHINPALTLDEQADLLPYDRNFEFPRSKLKLGKQLGAGAFGVVLKGFAEGIKPDEKESVVAVKMVKRTADNEVVKALVSELKIMVHLGQHLNVVNLLGAITKDIAKRELMVIVEYCRYGNVQNFLLRNRKRFINQINPETDKIDPSIMTQRFSDNFEYNRDGKVKYVNLNFSNHQYINHMNNVNNNYTQNSTNRSNSDANDPRSGTRGGRPNSRGYLRQSDLYEGPAVNSGATEQTVMTTIPDDENVMSNNSVQPAWRSNYKTDSTEAMTVTTSDLISWAFQVARGMEYLSSRKVLHGDLAARNILLCEDNVVKICDFGLARSMYRSDNYKKQGEAPLPIKWLALESLSDHVFSTYTDVWSFGIVMWEFFSLAKVPYPGMDPNQSLYMKLKDGYRMEKPPYANDELYDIMLECWSTNPESRPLFGELEKRFARMLGDDVATHYVDLNDPYMRINNEYRRRTETDYLGLMGSPDEFAPAPPPSGARYVNGHILPEIRIQTSSDDYLQMNTNDGSAIFSPTRPNDYEPSKPYETPIHQANNAKPHITSFTFPDTQQVASGPSSGAAPQAAYVALPSPTLVNNLDSPLQKQRKKDGLQQAPEEIPMLHKQTHLSDSDGEGGAGDSPTQQKRFANILKQTRNTPTPSPRHHIAETKLSNSSPSSSSRRQDDNYVNVMAGSSAANGNGTGNGRAIEAISNPSYQMLKKTDI